MYYHGTPLQTFHFCSTRGASGDYVCLLYKHHELVREYVVSTTHLKKKWATSTGCPSFHTKIYLPWTDCCSSPLVNDRHKGCQNSPCFFYRYMGVSWNRGTPKSSILVGFSLINQPFWIPPWRAGNLHMMANWTPPPWIDLLWDVGGTPWS